MLSAHSVRRLVAAAGIAGLGTAFTATATHAAPAMAQPEAATTAAAPTDPAAETGADTGSAATSTAATHTVVSGDTLWKIADANGVAGSWQALYDLNRDQLTKGPDWLDIGRILKLTGTAPAETGSSSQTATRTAATTETSETTAPTTQSTAGSTATQVAAPAAGKAAAAIAFAKAQLGKPYVYGAEGPDAYDCSGLVQAAWKAAGVSIPRVTTDQYAAGDKVAISDLQPGDLVFYYSGISHVGMYLGDGQIIHAPNSRSVVKIVPVDSMPIAGATRPA